MTTTHLSALVKGPLVLCILDGWGIHSRDSQNAITMAKTPFWDRFVSEYPHSYIKTSGPDVGLPEGQMGNSEVGHMAIGSGRITLQDLPRIDSAITDGTMAAHPLLKNIAMLKETKKQCHLVGLLSPGGVHSHQNHLLALAQIIAAEGVPVVIHAFLDGRDTPPSSAVEYIREFQLSLGSNPLVQFATVSGRYYGMDRDKRWDRVKLAYDAIIDGAGMHYESPLAMIEANYQQQVTDEFMKPAVIGGYKGASDGDALIMANFRADRVRQLLEAFLDPAFEAFERDRICRFSHAVGMTEYSEKLNAFISTLFPPQDMKNVLGDVLAQQGLKQLRIAETEKYAHVTFFFNGGREALFDGEERIMVPSPRVATYDLKPEMSAPEVTKQLVSALKSKKFDVIVVNFANTDMVGHTGILPAAIKAVETVDECLGKIAAEVLAQQGCLLITADHGNAEEMQDINTGDPHTAHTLNPVPFMVICDVLKHAKVYPGKLADIAPTMLYILGISAPEEMGGHSLIVRGDSHD